MEDLEGAHEKKKEKKIIKKMHCAKVYAHVAHLQARRINVRLYSPKHHIAPEKVRSRKGRRWCKIQSQRDSCWRNSSYIEEKEFFMTIAYPLPLLLPPLLPPKPEPHDLNCCATGS